MTDRNTSYVFLPFSFARQEDFGALTAALDASPVWEPVHDEITYMLKFVADKLDSTDRKNCQCFHYRLADTARAQFGMASAEEWYTTREHPYRGQDERFRFALLSAQLYCFSTGVCIMAFRIRLEKDDPFWIAAAQYYLKKVSREPIRPDAGGEEVTMLDLAKALMAPLAQVSDFRFFYYANPSTERSNLLTYLEVEPQESYKKELYYLRHCYNDGFLYVENESLDRTEIYAASQDTTWGISPEAAVCLACPALGHADFIRNGFYKNFNAQYLFMYVLLLHQKYVLYLFLTQMGVGIYNDLETLEEYRNRLYEFETDFVFSCVTEVPQYQNLYERMGEAFSLRRMYEDVHEPLTSLSEVRRAAADKAQKRRDDRVSKALFMLSILSFFSALVDSFDFVESFCGWFLTELGIRIVQVCCIVGIAATALYVLLSVLRMTKED